MSPQNILTTCAYIILQNISSQKGIHLLISSLQCIHTFISENIHFSSCSYIYNCKCQKVTNFNKVSERIKGGKNTVSPKKKHNYNNHMSNTSILKFVTDLQLTVLNYGILNKHTILL